MIISNIMPINRNIECNICENDNCFIKLCEPDYFLLKNVGKHTMSYKKGQYIIREGESVSGIYFIKEGKIKVVSSGLNGKEQIVRLASDGHILGHRGYGGEIYPIGAVALLVNSLWFLANFKTCIPTTFADPFEVTIVVFSLIYLFNSSIAP